MEDVIEQMKKIQSRIGSAIDGSNRQNVTANQKTEIVGGAGIEIKTDGNKVSISKTSEDSGSTGETGATGPGITLPSGTGVLGINNGVLSVYKTTECS